MMAARAFRFTVIACLTIAVLLPMPSVSSSSQASEILVIAHRGASGYLPEHTLEAKAMAHAMGADFIEQDVVLTRDNVPVVLHDHYLDTISNVATLFPDRAREDGRFYAIDFTLKEVKQLSAHERIDLRTKKAVFPERFPLETGHFKIPTLEEELVLIKGMNKARGVEIGLYSEIKAPAFHRAEGKDISRVVIEVLAKHGYATKHDALFLQCFDFNEVKRIRDELGYKGKLIQLIAENAWNEAPNVDYDHLRTAQGLLEIAQYADGIGPWINHVISGQKQGGTYEVTSLVKAAHESGLKVHPYTMRADALPVWAKSHDHLMAILVDQAKVDGVFTDFPDLAVGFLAKR